MYKWLLISFLVVIVAPTFAAESNYRVLKRVQLGGEGGWDLLALDSDAGKLYISRSTRVMVVDINSEKIVGEIPDTPGVHGIAVAKDLNRGFISAGKLDSAVVFDLQTLKIIGQVKTGSNPDAILYDSATKRVFVFNGRSKNVTVIDAGTLKVAGTIELRGKPELASAAGNGKIFVNIEDTGEVLEIESSKLEVSKRFSIKPCEEPSGIGYDPLHHHIFSGCHNKIMTVLDTETGQVISTLPIGEGVDGNGFDPVTGLAFSSNGDGTLTIVKEISPGSFKVVETVKTERGSRTMIIDPKSHNIYLPVAAFSPAPAATPEVPRPRPVMIKDTFGLLVVGK